MPLSSAPLCLRFRGGMTMKPPCVGVSSFWTIAIPRMPAISAEWSSRLIYPACVYGSGFKEIRLIVLVFV
jgi:hypothetical protein